jgi:hypothetical protein
MFRDKWTRGVWLYGLALGALAAWLMLRPSPAAPEDNQIRWSRMGWEPMNVNGRVVEHAALMADVELKGSGHGLMQLDLGAYSSVLYGSGGRNGVVTSGAIARRPFEDERFGFRGDAPGAGHLGAIGSSFFERRILVLDFVKGRLAILGKGAALPDTLWRGVEYLPLKFQYGHVMLAARINGREEPNLFFDTGSSMVPLLTGRQRWMEWTHRQPDDPANTVVRANAWGKEIVALGAPIEGALCMGSACLFQPLVYFIPSPPPNLDFDQYSSVATGLVGNVLFDGRYTVIVDIAGKRFGLLRGSPAG